MNHTDTGKDKIRKICEVLREETLEPAKEEAQKIIEKATIESERILSQAQEKAQEIIKNGQEELEKKKKIFDTSLEQTFRQSLSALRSEIEENLFNKELSAWLEKTTSDPLIVSSLIQALVKALDKEGTSVDFSAYIPESVPAEKVTQLLGEQMVKKLREKKVVIGEFKGGAQIRMHDKKILLDLSDAALKDLVAGYTRKEFRKILFPE